MIAATRNLPRDRFGSSAIAAVDFCEHILNYPFYEFILAYHRIARPSPCALRAAGSRASQKDAKCPILISAPPLSF
ncbi:hypothetical protein MPC4_40113 [Methylocella tundrae]|uniref:Uncharacterized protein n=1 Tax=Methylocella tundrae TaxID=227605 RepID=A0A8B6MBW2_METTU|nr:hypothetical protein MPC4_40113 [Methylocella tundrae]